MPSWWEKALDSGYYEKKGFVSEFPSATGFVPAHENNFTEMSRGAGNIDLVVIHITGGDYVGSAINTFAAETNPNHTSAHYLIGRTGKIYQMVWEKDRAHHAGGSANRRSIGIEHVADNRSNYPTRDQYLASAGLVLYLCKKYNIPVDRQHIMGHQEVATTSHNCPGPYWDWTEYMRTITIVRSLIYLGPILWRG